MLFGFQLAGEKLVKLSGLPVPGPVAGMAMLFAVLVISPPVLNQLGITDWAARGLALGTAARGIGMARAGQVNEAAGAFAGLAMGLNGVLTAILLPLLWRLLT